MSGMPECGAAVAARAGALRAALLAWLRARRRLRRSRAGSRAAAAGRSWCPGGVALLAFAAPAGKRAAW